MAAARATTAHYRRKSEVLLLWDGTAFVASEARVDRNVKHSLMSRREGNRISFLEFSSFEANSKGFLEDKLVTLKWILGLICKWEH